MPSDELWKGLQGMGAWFAGKGPAYERVQQLNRQEAMEADKQRATESMIRARAALSRGDTNAARVIFGETIQSVSPEVGAKFKESYLDQTDEGLVRNFMDEFQVMQDMGVIKTPEVKSGWSNVSTGEDGNRYGISNADPSAGLVQIPGPEGVRFKSGGPTVNVNTAGVSEYQKSRGKNLAETVSGIEEDGRNARSQLALIQPLLAMDVETGYGKKGQLAAARLGGLLFGEDVGKLIYEQTSEAEAFEALSETLVNNTLNLAKGPQTDQDAIRVRSTLASLGKTPQANKFILGYSSGVQRRMIERAKFFSEEVNEKGTNFKEVQSSWDQYLDSTPLVSASVYQKGTTIPMTFYEFEQAAKEKNKGISRQVIEQKWRELNGIN